ncbi:MAG TPA: AAA family ATPase, partial [Gemmatimonadaceae bacterium]|nr:AAA family ATPase [Gemmatimonadaceae bacterium]
MLRAVTFGQCTFETSQVRIASDSEIHFAILLTVAASPPEGILRDALVSRIWPRADDEERRHRLRQAMYRLRQLDVPVHLRGGSVVFEWERTWIDVHRLLWATPPREELVRLGGAPFLPSYAPALGEPFAHWLEELRARVATRLRRALSDEVTATRSRGRFHEMGQVARALLAIDPLNEVGTLALAEALALEGSKVEALRLLEDYEEEVGAISTDLQLPVRVLRRRVAEVLDDSLVLRRFELPFVGREREFETLRQLLREVRAGGSRSAVVTGEAGVGKSRLAGELLRLAALDGATVASYTPSAGDTFTPVSTLVTVGQLLLTLPGALGCAQEHLQYVRRLGTPETVTVWSVSGMAADILYAQ